MHNYEVNLYSLRLDSKIKGFKSQCGGNKKYMHSCGAKFVSKEATRKTI